MPFSPHLSRPGLALLVAALLSSAVPRPAAAADTEVRDFTTYIDGRRAGDYRMTITRQDDGSVTMSGRARVNLRILLVTYRYAYEGTESWKGGRLQQFQSRTNDNGRAFDVSAVADANGLLVRVNNQPGRAPADAWVTTYWQLPDAAARAKPLTLVDADTGRVFPATLQVIGPSQVSVAGTLQNCTHYRAAGQTQVDLWYDDKDRLVRQEWVEDNHKAVLVLTAVQH